MNPVISCFVLTAPAIDWGVKVLYNIAPGFSQATAITLIEDETGVSLATAVAAVPLAPAELPEPVPEEELVYQPGFKAPSAEEGEAVAKSEPEQTPSY